MFAVLRVFSFSEFRERAANDSSGMAVKWCSLTAGIILLAIAGLTLITGLAGIWTFFESGFEKSRELEIMNLSFQLIGGAAVLAVISVLLSVFALFKKPRVW